jgi:3-hydroxyacyl-[acyl-carrier-protein] dehydratase
MIETKDLIGLLPHKPPFLFIDKIIKLDPPPETGSWVGRRGTVIKNVTHNEAFFSGHFPHRPVMPGALVIEAMAQAAAVVGYRAPEGGEKLDVAFLGIDNARFRKAVLPGDQLRIEIKVVKDRGSLFTCHGEAFVENQLVAEADLMAKSFVQKEL